MAQECQDCAAGMYWGNLTSAQLFAPYGASRYSSGTMPTSYGFTGQRGDPSGLTYMHARYYDGTVGAFTAADLVQGPNRYGYVAGNPTTLTDPTGQMAPCGGQGMDDGMCLNGYHHTNLKDQYDNEECLTLVCGKLLNGGTLDRYHDLCVSWHEQCKDSDPAPSICSAAYNCGSDKSSASWLRVQGVGEITGAVVIIAAYLIAGLATEGIADFAAGLVTYLGGPGPSIMLAISLALAGLADVIQANTRLSNYDHNITIGEERSNLQVVAALRFASAVANIISSVWGMFNLLNSNGLSEAEAAVTWIITVVKAVWGVLQAVVSGTSIIAEIQQLPSAPEINLPEFYPTSTPPTQCFYPGIQHGQPWCQ